MSEGTKASTEQGIIDVRLAESPKLAAQRLFEEVRRGVRGQLWTGTGPWPKRASHTAGEVVVRF